LASEVIEELQVSDDPLERELGEALLKWQNDKASQGLSRSLGYEPREIREKGAVAVISARVMNSSSGFEEIDKDSSYEAIVNRHPDRFEEGVVFMAKRRLKRSEPGSSIISSEDVRLIASARSKQKFADLTIEEREAYTAVSSALQALGNHLRSHLSNPDKFEVRTTAGFNTKSGVRGGIPKDLWFGVYSSENAEDLAGNPQLFMIASERGLELGYAATTHPSDFSNPGLKQKVREIAPIIYQALPDPHSDEADRIAQQIATNADWHFRKKSRQEAETSDFQEFHFWLSYLKSSEGAKNAGGTISRYIAPGEVHDVDLFEEVAELARVFEPLLDRNWGTGSHKLAQDEEVDTTKAIEELARQSEFAALLRRFMEAFRNGRGGPFTTEGELGRVMRDLREWLHDLPAISSRPDIKVKVSVGQGGWTKTPWIALLDARETTSTQRGRYVVFLVAEDLSRTYLTLNQGMTELVGGLGQRGAVEEMHRVAEQSRISISAINGQGFSLSRDIDLGSDTNAAKNYEEGTIAYVEIPSDDIPDDRTINAYLDTALWAYGQIIEPDNKTDDEEEALPFVEPYSIDDALAELFLEREDVERYLDIWRNKKNLILQGAPGVGKSFIARRLAYALIGFKDDQKVQTVQFHQSYSYEDFVQGYRPNGNQGFERKNGTFFEFRDRALSDPDGTYVFIIDEINRGNLSKIFGELMLLIEPDKRGPEWKTRLAYATESDRDFFVPENLLILGMMNTADRSLSLVDYALRRRFAFVAMEPLYGAPKYCGHLQELGVPEEVISQITNGMGELNQAIESDRTNLGPGFRIGHSFFTPTTQVADAEKWFRRIVETEIHPLLEEYWFDAPETADQWRDQLLR